jgi:hypothetical protein
MYLIAYLIKESYIQIKFYSELEGLRIGSRESQVRLLMTGLWLLNVH